MTTIRRLYMPYVGGGKWGEGLPFIQPNLGEHATPFKRNKIPYSVWVRQYDYLYNK